MFTRSGYPYDILRVIPANNIKLRTGRGDVGVKERLRVYKSSGRADRARRYGRQQIHRRRREHLQTMTCTYNRRLSNLLGVSGTKDNAKHGGEEREREREKKRTREASGFPTGCCRGRRSQRHRNSGADKQTNGICISCSETMARVE